MTDEQVEGLVTAITRISYGGDWGPAGLELLSMAISGDSNARPLGPALDELGSSINEGLLEVACSLNNIADAIKMGAMISD